MRYRGGEDGADWKMDFVAPPEEYGISHEVAERIHALYVKEEKTIPETASALAKEMETPVSKNRVGKFVKANGWSRGSSHYAKKSIWVGMSRASYQAAKAAKKRRGEWVG